MGLELKLIIAKKEEPNEGDGNNVEETPAGSNDHIKAKVDTEEAKSNGNDVSAAAAAATTSDTTDDITHNTNDDTKNGDENINDLFSMQVESIGKFTRKANWADLNRFTGKDITSDVLRDMIVNYQKTCFPDDHAKPNSTPKYCYIKDENGSTIYKDFGWKPIKLNLTTGMVDIKERWTKEVVLETFPLDYTTNLEKILIEKGDKKITSTLRKSKLAGHPLAKEMMKTKSDIVTVFKGELDATTCVLGNTTEPSEIDEDTGDEVWKDVKSLRALLHGATLPKKSGAGVSRDVGVLANESYLKARVYYRAFFVNDVATDHVEPFQGKPYWKFPIKYLFQYNDIPNAVVVYEDIELRFFTEIRIAMDNKDFEWVKDEAGRWKKQYAVKTTTVSRAKAKPIAVDKPISTSKGSTTPVDAKASAPVSPSKTPVNSRSKLPDKKFEAAKTSLSRENKLQAVESDKGPKSLSEEICGNVVESTSGNDESQSAAPQSQLDVVDSPEAVDECTITDEDGDYTGKSVDESSLQASANDDNTVGEEQESDNVDANCDINQVRDDDTNKNDDVVVDDDSIHQEPSASCCSLVAEPSEAASLGSVEGGNNFTSLSRIPTSSQSIPDGNSKSDGYQVEEEKDISIMKSPKPDPDGFHSSQFMMAADLPIVNGGQQDP